jgi:tetratricopeptide (TPR) repeat protein
VESSTIPGVINVPSRDGARSKDPAKYVKDAQILETALQKEPNNKRYQFYLGQSYRDAKMPEKSKQAYLDRAKMGGWEEEVWYSLYQAAKLAVILQERETEVVHAFLRAFDARPARAEPLCYLARYLRQQKRYALAHLFATKAASLAMPDDLLFVDSAVYEWCAKDEQAVASYYLGAHDEAIRINRELLELPSLPETRRTRIQNNLRLSQLAVGSAIEGEAA